MWGDKAGDAGLGWEKGEKKKKKKKKAEPEARAVLRNLPRGFWVNVHG